MNWDNVREEWETSKITLKDLSAKHDIKLGTLKSRKSREQWSRGAIKHKKPKRNYSESELHELMGVNRDTYKRVGKN